VTQTVTVDQAPAFVIVSLALATSHAEKDNLRALTAVIDPPAQRAESAFRIRLGGPGA
jgi:hypothetical protein